MGEGKRSWWVYTIKIHYMIFSKSNKILYLKAYKCVNLTTFMHRGDLDLQEWSCSMNLDYKQFNSLNLLYKNERKCAQTPFLSVCFHSILMLEEFQRSLLRVK